MDKRVFEGNMKSIGSLFLTNVHFSTEHNIRNLKWGTTQVQWFFDTVDRVDLEDDDTRVVGSVILSPRKLTKKEKHERGMSPAGTLYDVQDGQQRLATVTLALAAARDVMGEFLDNLPVNDVNEQEPCITQQTNRITEEIAPTRIQGRGTVRRTASTSGRVPRLQLRGNKAMEKICIPVQSAASSPKSKQKLSIEQALLLESSEPNSSKVIAIYKFFVERFQEMTSNEADGVERIVDFITKLMERTFVISMEFTGGRAAAEQQVMDQCYAMGMEPIEFKSFAFLSCDTVDDRDTREATFFAFKDLVTEKGEKLVGDACNVLAQLDSARNDNTLALSHEVQVFQEVIKRLSADGVGGKQFYDQDLLPVVNILQALRRKSSVQCTLLKNTLAYFSTMRGALNQSTRFNEVESVVVAIRHFLDENQECVRALRALEPLAYWIMHQHKKVRTKRCFSVLNKLDTNRSTLGANLSKALELEPEEKTDICKLLSEAEAGDEKRLKYQVILGDIVLTHLSSANEEVRNVWGLPTATLVANAPRDNAAVPIPASTREVNKPKTMDLGLGHQPLMRQSNGTGSVANRSADPRSVATSVEEDSKPSAALKSASSAWDQDDDDAMAAPPGKKLKTKD